MYTVSGKLGIARASTRLNTGSVYGWRSYSAPSEQEKLQRLRDMFSKARDTSARWQKPPNPRANTRNRTNRPIIGGSARNNLKSAHTTSAMPIFKPFFEQESSAGAFTKTSAGTADKPRVQSADAGMPSKNDSQAAPELNKPKPQGSAKFFFLGKGSPLSRELPSKAWAGKISSPKASTSERDKGIKTTGTSRQKPPPLPLGTNTSPITDPPAGETDGRSSKVPKRMREFTKRETLPEKSKASGKVPPPPQHRERRHAGNKFVGCDGITEEGGMLQHSHGLVGGLGDGGGIDGGAQRRRRRKRYSMPKKGQEVVLPISITVDGLAKLLDVPNDHLIQKMEKLGMDKLANDYLLSNEEAAEIALEYEVVPIIPENNGPELYPRPEPEDMSEHPLRPPIVTIMGHVDHGKTTLLDTLRSSSITASEAGGITQHIGAFSVEMKSGQHITFLDTPGHAAFSAMRARGANVTDIVVLVVAADDGVMPQTKEAIKHAQDADVPIIVAINKCDKPGVDPSLIREELLQHGVQTEDLGGDIQAVEISALKGTGVDELAENIATLAEVLDLRAEVDIPAEASVIESQIEKGRGNVASVLVNRGTLRVGDAIVAGTAWCKVRSMTDDRGKSVKSAGPACAVKIMGWKELPQAGDMVLQAESEAQAKSVVENREEKRKNKAKLEDIEAMNDKRRENHAREDSERAEDKAFRRAVWEFHKGIRTTYPEAPGSKTGKNASPANSSGSLEGASDGAGGSGEGGISVVPVVIKGDVSGTVEAVADALKQLPDKKIKVNIINTGVGPVTESDVVMASSGAQGVIIAFNVKADKKTLTVAKREGVEVMSFRIIYKLLEDVEKLLASRLDPITVEEVQGEAVIQQIFEITLKGNAKANIAGSRVTVGSVAKASKARVVRGDKVLFTGDVSSLKNTKKDISEALKGQEFGISFAGFEDMQEGDVIQSLRYKEIPQKLE
ncbi:initiation factor 2 [Martensiomyces pterosporus]|nr:initiation factor 2 [Martensiomyces pterosporus]